jgi:hypothetical protein
MKNTTIIAALILNTPALLSAQTPSSLGEVQRAQLEISNTMNLLEQNILLIFSACIVLLGILLVFYVFKVSTQINRNPQPPHQRSILFLLMGMSLYCSSCGSAKQVETTAPGFSLNTEHHTCPHHQNDQEPLAFRSMYRTKGFPQQRISSCRFCGKKQVLDQE